MVDNIIYAAHFRIVVQNYTSNKKFITSATNTMWSCDEQILPFKMCRARTSE